MMMMMMMMVIMKKMTMMMRMMIMPTTANLMKLIMTLPSSGEYTLERCDGLRASVTPGLFQWESCPPGRSNQA